MFTTFLERKGWLNFNGRKDYLKALFADYHVNEDNKRTANFHKSRLNTLFFRGLNNPYGDQLSKDPKYKIFQRLIGDVPYLNGGLFEEEAEDIDGFTFPDTVVAKILTGLIYQFNFTVTESTPLDVEVAVDPEMLGRIFEELVTGRHESGSYYTPKPVVAFMCREALKGYLETALPDQTKEVLRAIPDRPISFEVFSDEFGEMERQASEIASWGDNVYVKIPVSNTRGESAAPLVRRLSQAGVKLNVTALLPLEQVREITHALAGGAPACISVFAGRMADTGVDPVPMMTDALAVMRDAPNAELIWASPRELLNIFQADAIGCHIITVTHDILKKLSLVGRDLRDYSLDTVKMFHTDAAQAGFTL